MQKIKKGDEVIAIAGKSKGNKGHVLTIKGNKVLVSGVNRAIKHERPNPQAGIEGGRAEKEMYLDISNVMLINPETGKADKVKIVLTETTDENGKKHVTRERYFKSNDKKVG